ncbi:hypothetical protein PRIPAC_96166 [Pristionchus pacificus]|uniref:Ribosomal protein n=1 Tax=Pristionchus pacificus TaxID=54126 RepID=A0A2A6CGG6_PRIPA|nr:hypothetical protein PRIPAC_96166 [Pristionchus pacificus]|eukprot:PDM77302.1 ribosomal protein [Pristionchus pacificus]
MVPFSARKEGQCFLQAVKRIVHFLKQTGKVKVSEWSDLVKLGVTKDMAPANPDWYYIRAASLAHRLYIRSPVGSFFKEIIESTQSEDGQGRILSKQGRKDLDRIAADLRTTIAPAELNIVMYFTVDRFFRQ